MDNVLKGEKDDEIELGCISPAVKNKFFLNSLKH